MKSGQQKNQATSSIAGVVTSLLEEILATFSHHLSPVVTSSVDGKLKADS
jgi:hypothetical protein